MPDVVAQMIKDTDKHMLQTVEATQRELSMIRTGRANPAVLHRVMVEYYGQKVPVNQVGTISTPEPRLLAITPWDKAMIKPIIDAITTSDLGLNPISDGNIIRVPVPQLTVERRKELVRLAAKKTEEGKIAVRNIRRDTIEKLRSLQHDGKISKDDFRRFQEQVQKTTDQHIEQLDKLQQIKEREIMEG